MLMKIATSKSYFTPEECEDFIDNGLSPYFNERMLALLEHVNDIWQVPASETLSIDYPVIQGTEWNTVPENAALTAFVLLTMSSTQGLVIDFEDCDCGGGFRGPGDVLLTKDTSRYRLTTDDDVVAVHLLKP